MTKKELQRYERNLLVDGFTEVHQERLSTARIAVVGAGGLGSSALSYLVAVGVGTVTIIENDTISLSNLQRQILYSSADIGEPKGDIAAMKLSSLNPHCHLQVVSERLTESNAYALLQGHDLVVECSDNYATRYAIDAACDQLQIPMVYGTAEQIGGQISTFHTLKSGSYRTLYPEEPIQKEVVGVLSPIVGVVGSLQALEAVKLLCGIGNTLDGRLLIIDGRTLQIEILEIPKA